MFAVNGDTVPLTPGDVASAGPGGRRGDAQSSGWGTLQVFCCLVAIALILATLGTQIGFGVEILHRLDKRAGTTPSSPSCSLPPSTSASPSSFPSSTSTSPSPSPSSSPSPSVSLCPSVEPQCCAEICLELRQVDLPLVVNETSCYRLVENLFWNDTLQVAIQAVGGTDVDLEVDFAGHELVAGEYVQVIRGASLYVHNGRISCTQQMPAAGPAIYANGGQRLVVRDMQIDGFQIGMFGISLGGGGMVVERTVVTGTTLKIPVNTQSLSAAVVGIATDLVVRDSRLVYKLAPDVTPADNIEVSFGVNVRAAPIGSGRSFRYQIERCHVEAARPIEMAAVGAGSTLNHVYAVMDTPAATPGNAVQIGRLDDSVLSHFSSDHLFITGTSGGVAGTAALVLGYNVHAEFTNLQTQTYTYYQVYVDTPVTTYLGLPFETRLVDIRRGFLRPAYGGQGILFSGDYGVTGTRLRLVDTVVQGIAEPAVFIAPGSSDVLLDNVELTGAFTGLVLSNATDRVRLARSNVNHCCQGAFLDVLATGAQLVQSTFFANDVHLVDLSAGPVALAGTAFDATTTPAHCIQPIALTLTTAQQEGERIVTGDAIPPVHDDLFFE